jgi:hypothetical protein
MHQKTGTLTNGQKAIDDFERKLYKSIGGPVYDKEKENWRILTDKVYNREEWKKLLRTVRNRRILDMVMG